MDRFRAGGGEHAVEVAPAREPRDRGEHEGTQVSAVTSGTISRASRLVFAV